MIRSIAGIVATMVVLGLVTTRNVSAECDGPFPSFREAAPSARTVVIGTVVNVEGRANAGDVSSRFTLQVEQTLRGATDPALLMRDVPSQPCAGPLAAGEGWRIAIAIDGTAYEPPIVVNAMAIIDGPAPELTGMERLTLDEILTLVPPLPESARDDELDPLPLVGSAALVLVVVFGLVVWRLRQEA